MFQIISLSFRLQTDNPSGFTDGIAKLTIPSSAASRPEAAEQPATTTLSPPRLTDGVIVFF